MLKKIKYFSFLILILIILYTLTAMYSFHQLHKGIYFNDKQLIENYVEDKNEKAALEKLLLDFFLILDKLLFKKKFARRPTWPELLVA